ncbi:tRNA-binding protein [Halovivax sp.]|uniref:tRNA-binding protein n=1 Tax=Halovivax sp. TaxID=1935978 RepID=UPI0025BC77B9|nr:tRNA-binding protein [Halovivax sp.]
MVESPFDVEIRVGEVLKAEAFPETNKPSMTKLWIDLGEDRGEIQSAAQLDRHYDPEELVGRRVLCATNLGSVRIAGFESEALTVGVPSDEGYPVLVSPDEEFDVSLGAVLY